MKNRIQYILLFSFLAYLLSCSNDNVFPVEPEISYVDISPKEVRQFRDSIIIKFSFTDGDGDLGNDDNQILDMVLIDDRVNDPVNPITPEQATIPYSLPNLTPKTRNPAIQGTITILVAPTAIRLGLPEDLTSFNIQVKDRAGHESNVIQTEPIRILP